MRRYLVALVLAVLPAVAVAQKEQKDEDFQKAKPAVGDTIPEVTLFTPEGKEVKTSSLQGQYVVITFGCLT